MRYIGAGVVLNFHHQKATVYYCFFDDDTTTENETELNHTDYLF
jgi:hypothetical protein